MNEITEKLTLPDTCRSDHIVVQKVTATANLGRVPCGISDEYRYWATAKEETGCWAWCGVSPSLCPSPSPQVCREDADQREPGPADPGREVPWTCPADCQQREDGDRHHAGEGCGAGSHSVTPGALASLTPLVFPCDTWAVSTRPLLPLSLSHVRLPVPEGVQGPSPTLVINRFSLRPSPWAP